MLTSQTRHAMKLRKRKLLEQTIRFLRPGDALPPVRTLMETCSVSRARLDAILGEFEKDGLIVRKPRMGIFKAPSTDELNIAPVVELVSCGISKDLLQHRSFVTELIEAFATETTRRHQGMRFHQVSVDDPMSRYDALAGRSDVRVCVLFAPTSTEQIRIFDWHHVPCVLLFPQIPMSEPRSVVDSPHMTEVQLKHLWELGHSRIAYMDMVSPDRPNWTQLSRRESFYRLMGEGGARVYPHWVANGLDANGVMSAFNTFFSREPYPTAAIIGDVQLPGSYRFLESRGLRVGKDFSVISTDDLAIASSLHPPATSIVNSRKIAVEMALELLDQILGGHEVKNAHEVPLKLAVRGSTGPCPVE